MSQTYPQFTPVQILEAGQRAFGEGRTDYAAQFFQHLIEHYGDTAEAAAARDTMAQINGAAAPAASHHQAGPVGQSNQANHAQTQQMQHGPGASPAASRPAPGYAQSPAPNGAQLSINGAAGHHNGHAPNGYAASAPAANGMSPRMAQRHNEPMLAPAPPAPSDVPSHIARNGDAALYEQGVSSRPSVATRRLLLPAPEKNYIIGRVIAGLLLMVGILGILASIIFVYVALTDPGIFSAIGLATPAQALYFSCSFFVGSIIALVGSQMATAVFDGADAAADLVRLERYRFGEDSED